MAEPTKTLKMKLATEELTRKQRIEDMCKTMMNGNAWTSSDLVNELVQVATKIIDEIDKLKEG
jgi:hypothetical protein